MNEKTFYVAVDPEIASTSAEMLGQYSATLIRNGGSLKNLYQLSGNASELQGWSPIEPKLEIDSVVPYAGGQWRVKAFEPAQYDCRWTVEYTLVNDRGNECRVIQEWLN